MSAQDDVLAAFGEPSGKAHAEDEAEVVEGGEVVEEEEEEVVVEEVVAEVEVVAEAEAVEETEAEEVEEVAAAEAVEAVEASAVEASAAQVTEATATAPPAQPYLDPAAFFAQLQAEAAPKPKRRWPRLVLRYASALVVAGAVGAGTAYAITLPRRTDVPFLATPSDGRYTFLFLAKPQPPAGEPAPGDDSNKGQVHYGDLRQYLLPAPAGAVRKEDGWESIADFGSSLSGSDVSDHLYDAGLRRIARRGWTAADGQHTIIELLQLPDHDAAYGVHNLLDSASLSKAGSPENVAPEVTVRGFEDETYDLAVHKLDQVNGLPGHVERRVVFQSGDVVAIVTTTAPTGVPDTPTEQVVMLQAEMLR